MKIPDDVPLQGCALAGAATIIAVDLLAYAVVRRRGMAVVVGASARDEQVTLPAASFLSEKILRGSAYGSGRPRVDMPRLIDLYTKGKLKLDELVTRTYRLADVNEAMSALERGEVVRSVLLM